MANRKNTFLLKRSNITNKIPTLSNLELGEVALNTADAKLFSTYTGGLTGATEIREIGWDRLSTISGGTVDGNVNINGVLSACTGIYTSNIYSCSPLNINPNDEGNVYFGSTSGLTIDVVNSRVGIGTTSPTHKLHVVDSEQCPSLFESTVAGGGIALMDSTTTDDSQVGIGAFGDNLCFRAGGSTAGNMRLLANGDFGIGTTSPTNKLHIDEGILRIENAPPNLSTINSVRENGIRLDAGSISSYAEIRPYNGASNTRIGLSFWVSDTTPTEVVRILPTGEMGIGNSNPDTKLDVNGNVTITDKIIHSEDTDTFIRFSNNDEITLDAGAQNQVKITSDGSGRVEIQKQLHAGDYVNIVGTGYDLHDGVSSIIDTGEFSEETTNLYVSGDILSNQVAGESGIRPSTLVYLETDKKWYIASATSAGEVDRFLGIALNSTSLGGTLDVLISGIINYNANASQHAQLTSGAEVGAPIYASTTSGVVTEVAPSSAGNIVKVLGHNISGNGILRTAVVRFQPDNTWIEL